MSKSSITTSIRADRIRIILKREKLTQLELAEKLEMEPQNVSRFLRSGKVSERICQRIVSLYPKYRFEWLLGIDDYMTAQDQLDSLIDRHARNHDETIAAIAYLSELKKIDFEPFAEGMIHTDGSVQDDFKIRIGEREGYITYSVLTDLIQDFAALTELRFSRSMTDNPLEV